MLPQILVQRGFELKQIFIFLFVQAIAAFVGYTACGFLIDRFGRRPVLFLYYFVGAFFHLWFAEATGIWIYFAIAAVGWVNPGVYGSNGVYVSELYPTHLRATAVGWFFGVGRIGSFLAPAVVGLMLVAGATAGSALAGPKAGAAGARAAAPLDLAHPTKALCKKSSYKIGYDVFSGTQPFANLVTKGLYDAAKAIGWFCPS